VIITDDQRYDTLAMMPNVRHEFGDVGERFRHAFVTTPLCCPSRASIFTGLYAHNHGVVENHGEALDTHHTWQANLQAAGYETGIAGKYLNGVATEDAPHFAFRRGWDDQDPEDTRLASSAAADFLSRSEGNDTRPWALVLATHSPHKLYTVEPSQPKTVPPFEPPPGYEEADLADKDAAVQEAAQSYWPPDPPRVWHGAAPEIQAIDEMVGSVFKTLRSFGEGRDTLAFFISDNGYLLGEHRLMAKGWPYTDAVEVPMYARWPGHITRGSVSYSLVANIDIAPTIYEATGVQPNYVPDGRSLLAPSGRQNILLELPGPWRNVPTWSAIWSPTRHYIHWSDGFVEDYHLGTDPGETDARNTPDPKMERRLDRYRTCAGATCP
jgi:arylsulfatase A-like enzyme